MENLKVDIIYNDTPNDFEMEFNLRGCCGIRLLTDKTAALKEYVMALSRAVARSKIIICCGALSGENGLVRITAKAIGKETQKVDCSEYGLKEGTDIEIIKGGVPLINNSGVFAGTIIESGPQSIILLSAEKTVRKTVLSSLIHPYLQEISIMEIERELHPIQKKDVAPLADPEEADVIATVPLGAAAATAAAVAVAAETAEATAEEVTETVEKPEINEVAEISENTQEDKEPETLAEENGSETVAEETVAEETENNEETAEDEDAAIIYDEDETESPEKEEKEAVTLQNMGDSPFLFPGEETADNELFIEPEEVMHEKTNRYEMEYIPSKEDEEFVAEIIEDEDEWEDFDDREDDEDNEEIEDEGKNKSLAIFIIIIALLLLVIIGAIGYILFYIPYSQGISTGEFIKNIISTLKG